MSGLADDVRLALRGFRRRPLFFAGVILVLALGIGANGAIFSLVESVLLAPLPYREPDRVVMVAHSRRDSPDHRDYYASTDLLLGLREGAGDVMDVAGMIVWSDNKLDMDLILEDRAERLRGAFVTPDFFHVLGVDAEVGRVFSAADEAAAVTPVVISHGLWSRLLGQDPRAVGRTLTLLGGFIERTPRTMLIVGVLPPRVGVTYPDPIDVWALYSGPDVNMVSAGADAFHLIGRLRPGISIERAEAQLGAVGEHIFARVPPDRRERLHLHAMADVVSGAARPHLLLVASVAGLLLLLACATVASALLVRLTERHRELAVRGSLGADRMRLLRQLVTEGATLAAAGTLAGSLVAAAAIPVLRSLLPISVPRGDEIGVDASFLIFAASAAAVVTILAALVPAFAASRVDLISAFKRGSPSASPAGPALRLRAALVAVQAAVATALVIGSILLLVSFWRLGRVDLGFDGDEVLTVEMRLLGARPKPVLAQFQEELIARVRGIPGVVEAGMTTAVPFRGVDFLYAYDAPGCETPPGQRPTPECGERRGANRRTVDPGYFSVMRIAPTRGRLLAATDTADAPRVAVVSESFARRMFGDENPLGRTFGSPPMQIVGVIPDLRYVSRTAEPYPAVYVSRAQDPSALICLVIRTTAGAEGVGAAVRRAVHETDPAVPAMHMTTVERIVGDSVADRRFYTTTSAAFACLALLLTAAGLILVIARSVVERQREIAIRNALGARSGQLIRLIARQGVIPAAAGTLGGLAAAWIASGMLEQFLFQVSARAPLIYIATGTATLAVAVAACLIPARRLSLVAPATVLRAE
jgi:predicted permease